MFPTDSSVSRWLLSSNKQSDAEFRTAMLRKQQSSKWTRYFSKNAAIKATITIFFISALLIAYRTTFTMKQPLFIKQTRYPIRKECAFKKRTDGCINATVIYLSGKFGFNNRFKSEVEDHHRKIANWGIFHGDNIFTYYQFPDYIKNDIKLIADVPKCIQTFHSLYLRILRLENVKSLLHDTGESIQRT